VGRLKHADHITAALLQWGSSELRDLPWRRESDPWRVLVSEVMLQQTSVVRVLPKFEPFINAFPTPHALSNAPLGEALTLWQGLGYPRRCRNLRDAAISIVEHHAGVVPCRLEELLALPGIGPYTARAVLAFAYRHDVAVVDVNVSRVFSRVCGTPMRARELQDLADELVPLGMSWEWNQVIMELGGRVCVARSPRCMSCPIHSWCAFARMTLEERAVDPASLSAGASKPQARFEGSDRQLRGKVLRIVLDSACAIDDIVMQCDDVTNSERVERIVADLVAEGLLIRSHNQISVP
jgi:A/G-specific adenine glycosylase